MSGIFPTLLTTGSQSVGMVSVLDLVPQMLQSLYLTCQLYLNTGPFNLYVSGKAIYVCNLVQHTKYY